MRNLIPNFIAEQFLANQSSGNFPASTMFLDISGFTPMTERLMKEGKEGAEILSSIINNIFEPVINAVYSSGGFVSTFAGDAFTAIFPETDQSLQVMACAVEIKEIFKEIGRQQTKFGEFELFVKLGLSAGIVDFGIIGSDEHKTYFFRGEAIDGCAHSEHHCEKMEIVLDQRILKLIAQNQIEINSIDAEYSKLIKCEQLFKESGKSTQSPLSREILQKFIPDQVLTLNQQGEFREVVSVFISFKEPKNHQKLNESVTEIINQCHHQGGYFNKIDFGDKGGVILVLFGAPVSYENNIVRALNFITHIKSTLHENIRAGITSGIAYTGFVGSLQRSEYTALGDIVNQSARFMMKAEWGEVWISELISKKISNIYQIDDLGKMDFKGKAEPISVFRLHTKKENADTAFFSGEMVGRQTELELLNNFAKPLLENKFAGIVTVYAEAGMGKSRLVYEFVKAQHNAEILFLQTDSVLRMSLNPFKYLLHNYFNQNTAVNKEQKKANFEAVFDLLLLILNNSSDERKLPIIKELERTKSILAAQVEVFYDNSLYEQLDAKASFENTLFAYKEFLRALSLFKPIIIQIEDIHWLDEDSQAALNTLCRTVDDFPIMIVATSRFNDDGSKPRLNVDKEVNQSEIILDKLDAKSGKYFMELLLEKLADDELISFVCNKAEYNPFYIEQIVCYLKENNLLAEKEGKYFLTKQEIAIPNSISAIIIARIDRLEYDVKNLLQMASVFGREVELKTFLIMIELYQLKVEQSQVKSMLEKIEDEQLWNKFAEIKYIFKHALLHEAAYEMQLKSRLRDLHKLAAQSLEKLYINEQEKFYEIARHYDKAEEIDSAVNYYEKAGDWLKKNYQNAQSIECYDRVIAFMDEEMDVERVIGVLNNKGEILQLIGKWTEAEEIYKKNIVFSNKIDNKKLLATCNCNLAWLIRDKGRPEEALILLKEAKSLAEKSKERKIYSVAVCNMGVVYYYKGDFDKAMDCYTEYKQICIELCDKSGFSNAISNIGRIYYDKGDYDKAMQCFEEKKQICLELGDNNSYSKSLVNIGNVYLNKGDNNNAMKCYVDYKQICLELGDKSGYSIAVGNIGLVYYHQGDYVKATEYFGEQKQICLELGDKSGYSRAVGHMGLVFNDKNDYDMAMQCFEEKKQICLELGDKSGYSRAVGNMGNVYWSKGNYDKTIECYLEYKQICLELGDRSSYSIVVGNIGLLHYDKGNYDEAMQYYNEAIDIARELNIKFYLCSLIQRKADLLNCLKEYKEARVFNLEANQIANEITRKDVIFNSTILDNKLLALENPTEAVANLFQMLESETDSENLATIHYEIYKINKSKEHGQKALHIYQELYGKTPNIEYKNRIDEFIDLGLI